LNYISPRTRLRDEQLIGLIENACVMLELSPTQEEAAKRRYEGVGEWLAASDDPLLASVSIRLQGSVAIRTTVKPIGTNEHDVDLIAHVADLDATLSPAELKARIGARLRDNGRYSPLLEEMPRCWRMNYANEFHMDITPSIPNPTCGMGGELVPDKTLKTWKPSNSQGYRAKFDRRAELLPRYRVNDILATDSVRKDADIEPYPDNSGFKGILRRIVQIAKRHRDIHFIDEDPCLAPLSIIITTLASRAYEYCVRNFVHGSEMELLCDVFRRMPDMMESSVVDGKVHWAIWNQTTAGENFAEKWNKDPRRAVAFHSWHTQALSDLEKLKAAEGLDEIRRLLGGVFGNAPAAKALDALTDGVTAARAVNRLSVTRSAGLVAGAAATAATPVRANTFFGRDC
jgi:Second Messenger Oligonucleotide or Dinucleotide Synthetase domain